MYRTKTKNSQSEPANKAKEAKEATGGKESKAPKVATAAGICAHKNPHPVRLEGHWARRSAPCPGGLALAVVTGAPSGSQNNSYICCCFISGTCAHSNCGGALVHRRKEKHWSVSFLFISYIRCRGTTGDTSTGDTGSTSADDSLSCY